MSCLPLNFCCDLLEEERKTLMLRLDRNINLCCDYMLRLHVAISCCNQMSIFQLDFPFLLLSISQNWNSAFTIAACESAAWLQGCSAATSQSTNVFFSG